MKKVKFFLSLYKERDWLEQMAAEGWLLQDITMGMVYYFKEIEPAQKVFEIENFGISDYPKKQEVTTRKLALDIIRETGWEVVTHDEDMNYYFVKDRAGDESDEFFDDDATRRERAEKYRKRYGYDQPYLLMVMLFVISVLYMMLGSTASTGGFDIIKFGAACNILIVAVVTALLWVSQRMYEELSMTRAQWERQKKYGVKKSFGKVKDLIGWLQEKEEQGLVLADYNQGQYLFKEGAEQYDYLADTKHALAKRLKEQGKKLKKDHKDWNQQSTEWYEQSINHAQAAGFELVCVVGKSLMLYRRPHTSQALPFDTQNESVEPMYATMGIGFVVIFIVFFAVGFLKGFLNI